MIPPETVKQLVNSSETRCLTLYFDTSPNLPRSSFQPRFRNMLRGLNGSIPPEDRKALDKVVERVSNYLDQLRSTSNSIVIYATDKTWQEFPSRVPVRDEIWWGKPNVNQLLWLLEEYRPYGVLIPDQQKVRFMTVRLNESEVYKEFTTDIDTADWRRHKMGSTTGGGQDVKGGSDVDSYNHKYEEHVRKFWKTLHKPLADLIERYHIRHLVIAGNKSLVPDFIKSLPEPMQKQIITQTNLETFASPADAVKKMLPEIEKWEQKREASVVSELISFAGVGTKAAMGIDSTLKYAQEGRVSRLVVAKGYDSEVAQCIKCRQVSTNHTEACRICGTDAPKKISLAGVLPELVVKHKVPIEIVKGGAGATLTKSGGIGVFLRY